MSALPAGAVVDRASLDGVRTDRSGTPGVDPIALVRAESVAHVQDVLRWASRTGTPVVPRGAGSGIAGAATVIVPSIVLDLSGMDRLVRLDPLDGLAVVEPGLITADLDRAARRVSLFYAPDPASAHLSTLGGNLATNAGGMRCVKYGGDPGFGARDRRGAGPRPPAAYGHDHREGRDRLRPDLAVRRFRRHARRGSHRPGPADAVAARAAGRPDAKHDRRRQGTDLSRRGGALLIAQADGSDATAQITAIAGALRPSATWIEHTDDPGRADELVAARRLALPSIETFERALIEDICVPRSQLATAVREIEAISARTGVTVHTFAHAGDGNLHPIISWDRDLVEPPDAVYAAAGQIFELALTLGGTLTGEHGVGLLKRAYAATELGDVALAVHRSIKAALDPRGLLNPGKAF